MDKNRSRPIQAGSRPITPGIPNPSCPILMEAKAVLEKTNDLHRAIHKLRRSTQRCPTCPENEECLANRYLADAMDTAIREVRQEWGLDNDR